jgi:hypothetical protein
MGSATVRLDPTSAFLAMGDRYVRLVTSLDTDRLDDVATQERTLRELVAMPREGC